MAREEIAGVRLVRLRGPSARVAVGVTAMEFYTAEVAVYRDV